MFTLKLYALKRVPHRNARDTMPIRPATNQVLFPQDISFNVTLTHIVKLNLGALRAEGVAILSKYLSLDGRGLG